MRNKAGVRDSGTGSKGFTSYSNYLKDKERREMTLLDKLDYRGEADRQMEQNDSGVFMFMKLKGKNQTGKPSHNQRQQGRLQSYKRSKNKEKVGLENRTVKEKGKTQPEYQQIDSSAVVVNGRLIYLKEESSSVPSRDHLLELLRQNGISNREYLQGDRGEILRRIAENQSEKQNEIIKDYILRNMNEQNNGEVLVMDRFYEVKNRLFSD